MRIIRREFYNMSRSDYITIVPLGDVHLGSVACDEDLLASTIQRIERDPNCYWLLMGDACDFIQSKDWRFNPGTLAEWITVKDLNNISGVQKDRFLSYVEPIAAKCLGVIEGNHELSIKSHYERDIYSEIVTEIKEMAGALEVYKLGLGYYGWLRMAFYSDEGNNVRSAIDICLHHGFVGGRLAGAKALNMERFLWTHNADLVLMGHSHNVATFRASVQGLDHRGNFVERVRKGAFTGTFLSDVNLDGESTYSERKGYLPNPVGTITIVLQPGNTDYNKRVKIVT